jgi:hypothetical protein
MSQDVDASHRWHGRCIGIVQMEDGHMTSIWHAFPTMVYRATFAAGLLTALAATATAPADRGLLAGEVAIEEPTSAPPPQTGPVEEQAPQQSEQPKERKRTYDGPPKDELLPNGRRLPA